MSELDDYDLMDPATPANPGAAKPRVCRRHVWVGLGTADQPDIIVCCERCGRVRNDAAARRGRTNRSRGNSIEREVGKKLGLRRVGQYGGPDDLAGDLFAAQVKSGGAFSERYWQWLRAVPVTAGQTPILVVTDAPGPGTKRRAVVVVAIDDWIALHGPTVAEDAA